MRIRASRETGYASLREYTCAICSISYICPPPGDCPLCLAKEALNDLTGEVEHFSSINRALLKENRSLRSRVETLDRLRDSMSMADGEEVRMVGWMVSRLFVTEREGYARLGLMYRKGSEMPVGFILNQFGREDVEFRCWTVGGVSLACGYEDAVRSYGSQSAAKALARAVGAIMDNSKNIDEHLDGDET